MKSDRETHKSVMFVKMCRTHNRGIKLQDIKRIVTNKAQTLKQTQNREKPMNNYMNQRRKNQNKDSKLLIS